MRVADVEAIFRALNDADVKYLVVGGFAVIAHGYLRSTLDVAVVIQLERDNNIRAMQVLEKIDYHPLVPVAATDFANEALRNSWREEKHMIVFQLRHSDPELRASTYSSPNLPYFLTNMLARIGNMSA